MRGEPCTECRKEIATRLVHDREGIGHHVCPGCVGRIITRRASTTQTEKVRMLACGRAPRPECPCEVCREALASTDDISARIERLKRELSRKP